MVKAQIAQLVEQGIENPRVGGSIPSLGTILRKHSAAKNARAQLLSPSIYYLFYCEYDGRLESDCRIGM